MPSPTHMQPNILLTCGKTLLLLLQEKKVLCFAKVFITFPVMSSYVK